MKQQRQALPSDIELNSSSNSKNAKRNPTDSSLTPVSGYGGKIRRGVY